MASDEQRCSNTWTMPVSYTHLKFRISSGDILIAMTGAEIGKLGIIPSTDKSLWLNQRVGLLAEKYKGGKYLAYLQLKSDFGQDYIENTANHCDTFFCPCKRLVISL